jgi:hypothetical protein
MQASVFGFFFLRDQRSPDKVMEPAVSARPTEKAGATGGHAVKSLNGSVAGTSLYTPQNVDVTIAYFAHVLRAETVDLLFPLAYWHGRVLQVNATPGLTHIQQERLQRLLDRIASLQACTAGEHRVSMHPVNRFWACRSLKPHGDNDKSPRTPLKGSC